MTALGDSLGCSRSPGSNSNSGLRAPKKDRPRCRQRGGSLAAFHPLRVGGSWWTTLMGPAMSSLPVRQTPRSASVDGHRSSPLQKRFGRLAVDVRPPCDLASRVTLLLSVVG